MIASVCLGFFGAILALVGMKCTKIGGSDATKARLTVVSGVHFVLSGNKHKFWDWVQSDSISIKVHYITNSKL